jgi:hypothetical protein
MASLLRFQNEERKNKTSRKKGLFHVMVWFSNKFTAEFLTMGLK